MRVYKRSIFGCILGIVGAHFAAFLVAIILEMFLSVTISIVLALIVYVLILYISIFSENIKIEVDDDRKILAYYKKGKLQKEYNLKDASLSYHIVTGKHANTMDLIINEDSIDCEPLGLSTFDKMYADLEKIVGVKPVPLKVGERKNK